jgi:hypothetical protein
VWQLAHWAATVTCVWFHFVGVQPVTLWQLKQLVAATGMCVPDLPVAALPLWHCAQLVLALKPLWFTLADDHVLVELWQLSQLPVTDAWIAEEGLPTAGGNAPEWQLAQPLPMLTALCTLAGVQLAKPARWQVSQLADAVAATLA